MWNLLQKRLALELVRTIASSAIVTHSSSKNSVQLHSITIFLYPINYNLAIQSIDTN